MRRSIQGALALAALLAAGATGERWWTRATPAPDGIASVTVAAQPFVRRVTAEGNLRAVTATEVVIPETPGMWVAMKVAWLAHDGRPVKAGDVVMRFDPSDAEKQLRDARSDLEAADAALRGEQIKAAATIADREAAALLARQDAEQDGQARDPLVYSRNDVLAGEIDARLAVAHQVQAEQAMPLDRQLSRSNIALLAIARDRALLALGHAKTALASMAVRAPADGLLVMRRDDRGELPRLGTALQPGSRVADLPALDAMEAELFVLEIDGTGLEVGQPADVVVESQPDRRFHGKIRLVDKLAKPRQPQVPVQYFSVVIALDHTDRAVMKPGQRVRATLVLDDRRALVVPRQAVFERAHQTIVYRRGDHGYAPAAVELGAATAGRVVITAGLVAGDVIALRDPTRSEPATSAAPPPAIQPPTGAPQESP
jgi:HlyD family secretion protein